MSIKKLSVYLILCKDCNFYFPVFSKLLRGFTLYMGVVPDLRLSVNFQFIVNGDDKKTPVIRSGFHRSFCFAENDQTLRLASSGMCIAECGLVYTLGGSDWRLLEVSGRGSHGGCWKSRGTCYYLVLGICIGFVEKLIATVRNRCNGSAVITPCTVDVS